MPSGKEPRTEPELIAQLTEQTGATVDELQGRCADALNIPRSQIGTLENADTIIGGRWPTAIYGSKRHRCELCENYVSLAPSSQRVLADRPAIHIICLRCAFQEPRQN